MPQVDYRRLNVLVIEDQQMIREIVVSILRAFGCNIVRSADNGERALRLVAEEAPNLIICDINMEPMDGFKFVEELHKAGFRDGKRIPTIYLTAHSTADFVQRAKQLGVDSYIVKPIKRVVLEERIQHVMSPPA